VKNIKNKILGLDDLRRVRDELRTSGKTVVQCHGCFDVVHPGHIRYLQFAREQGDALIVSISADEVVGKGADRPYINEDLRAENIASFEFVDYVVVDRNTWAGPVLEALKPDVYVKGKEYERSTDSRFARERNLVEEYGGRVIFSSGDVVYSSTYLIGHWNGRMRLDRERLRFFCKRHAIARTSLDATLRKMTGKRVLVLGDAILDRYLHCEARGIAAESPVVSVTPVSEQWFLGAGALVAGQITALGGEACLVTAYGDHPQAGRFETELAQAGIALRKVDVDHRPVVVKTRYLVDEKKVFKVDEGKRAALSTAATRELEAAIDKELAAHDALVVTDFGYGLLGAELTDAIVEIAERHAKPYFVDVSHTGHANVLKFRRPRFGTPTESELRFSLGDNDSGLSNLASKYFAATEAARLVLTMGRRGLIVFTNQPDGAGRLPTDYLPALAPTAIDEVGAGDVLLATLVASELVGAPPALGAYLASIVAALKVTKLGNAPVELSEVLDELARREELATVEAPFEDDARLPSLPPGVSR
jgi:rfaE bifunctional protein kinase chain/domain/rfaE bifunctional protein nucleotidyltransferase chain/domain